MRKVFVRSVFVLLLTSYILSHFFGHAHAQSSLGIGSNEAMAPSSGLFSGLLAWINLNQQAFYRSLTGAMKAVRDGDGGSWGGLWLVVGLSFAYGIFHAAGPGHGKAVVSSYVLANEVALRRGIVISFVSAFLQGLVAIVVMAVAFLALRGSAVSMTDATRFLEIASYVLITAFGAWLLWRKAGSRLGSLFGRRPTHDLSSAHVGALAEHTHGPGCGHARLATLGKGRSSTSKPAICEDCGHSHAPDPAMLAGEQFDWRSAWTAVAAVGVRPCSGALIVLSFSLLNGMWAAGLLSVAAMSLGTAITVSALATLAVTAKNWAVAIAGDGRAGNRVHATIEIGGAAFVFLLGILLLSASLAA